MIYHEHILGRVVFSFERFILSIQFLQKNWMR